MVSFFGHMSASSVFAVLKATDEGFFFQLTYSLLNSHGKGLKRFSIIQKHMECYPSAGPQ